MTGPAPNVPGATRLTEAETELLTRRGLRLAQFTVGYNVLEGVVAITAGLVAGLVSLVGFGIDSAIESISAVLVGLRLSARLRHGEADEAKERRALKAVASTFFLLAAYVIFEGTRSLINGETPDHSTVGIVLLAASVVVMPLLARAKRRVGEALGGDPLILADAAETRICVLLSVSTLLALGLYSITGAAWLDPVAGFVIALFAIHEGREAWEGELVKDDETHPVLARTSVRLWPRSGLPYFFAARTTLPSRSHADLGRTQAGDTGYTRGPMRH